MLEVHTGVLEWKMRFLVERKRIYPLPREGRGRKRGSAGRHMCLSSVDMPMLSGCGIGIKRSNVRALKPRH